MKTLLLEQMTSPQIHDAIQNGYRTVIVAAGSIEQHGKHLPVGMDAMAGYLVAVGIAEELGGALVAPVIRPGCSDHHMTFSGTISIPPTLLQELCRAYCHSLCHHGFERIVLIATHGGNFDAMEEITPEIDAELPCKVVWVNLFRNPKADEVGDSVLTRYGVTSQEGGAHAGFFETSLLLASSFGQWADMPVAQRGFVGDAWEKVQELKSKGSWNIADISEIGVLGDPTRATAGAGEALMQALIPVYAQAVRDRESPF
jgi:creatinine amidohydrolase